VRENVWWWGGASWLRREIVSVWVFFSPLLPHAVKHIAKIIAAIKIIDFFI